ncbi:MAG: hypothetical protein CM1200mP2_39710 [Planctomycetaceae bacterium]|nr:MAG: hypothetical protein CM1200mP2_39710 [Planctomycetaceae bacterium]
MACGYPTYHVMGINPRGNGDVTKSHITWHSRGAKCYVPSPVVFDKYLLVADDRGTGNCFNAKTGDRLWQGRLGRHFSGSLVTARGLASSSPMTESPRPSNRVRNFRWLPRTSWANSPTPPRQSPTTASTSVARNTCSASGPRRRPESDPRLLIALLLLLPADGRAADDRATTPGQIPAKQAEFFEREVRPLFVKHCFECHRPSPNPAGRPEAGHSR